ncbi:winged helix-turn-helix domain-containing protein [Morganella psychrotolerans]|uniref:winged helix-turn-helix domain-containing protein n=1 Tax=Morganella psychrotolerans TaxID=368603 RepID=UPI0039B033A6
MKYLINHHIVYDSHQGLLYTDNIDEPTRLTTTLNRLLLVMVQNCGEILDREMLLQRVWQDYNQVVSDNNLNSNISVLRRHLSSFSDDEMIITVPKIGIKFTAQLEYPDINNEEPSQDQSMPSSELTDDVVIMEQQPSSVPASEKKSHILNNRYIEISLVIVIIFCLLYLFKSYFFTSQKEYPEVGRIDQCSIRYINSYHQPDSQSMNLTKLQDKLSVLNIDCKKPATIFYYNVGLTTDDTDNDGKFLFISYCPKTPKDNTMVSCENFHVK